MTITDTTGNRFGRLTVLSELSGTKKGGYKGRRAQCKCDCGNMIIVNKYRLIHGYIISCGCHKKDKESKHKHIIGKKFGKLVVTKIFRTGAHYMAECLCDCGNVSHPYVRSLLHGRSQSCGCRRDQYEKISGQNSKNYTGYKKLDGSLWHRFQRRAKTKGLTFEIDLRYAWELFENQKGLCAMTGVPLTIGSRGTASLDRIDPSVGYIHGNLQWVHKNVNFMRNIYSIEHFVEVCLLVAHKHGWAPISDESTQTSLDPPMFTTEFGKHTSDAGPFGRK